MENSILISQFPQDANVIYFKSLNEEIIKLCYNGDIFVKGKLVENDKEVVEALREFLKEQGYLKIKY